MLKWSNQVLHAYLGGTLLSFVVAVPFATMFLATVPQGVPSLLSKTSAGHEIFAVLGQTAGNWTLTALAATITLAVLTFGAFKSLSKCQPGPLLLSQFVAVLLSFLGGTAGPAVQQDLHLVALDAALAVGVVLLIAATIIAGLEWRAAHA